MHRLNDSNDSDDETTAAEDIEVAEARRRRMQRLSNTGEATARGENARVHGACHGRAWLHSAPYVRKSVKVGSQPQQEVR
jgi:hypothetical protein